LMPISGHVLPIHGEQKSSYPLPKYSVPSVTSVRALLFLLSDKAHTWDAYSEGHLTRPLEAGSRGSASLPLPYLTKPQWLENGQ
jgi:hypothetical protein